jgi:hypothetical protein
MVYVAALQRDLSVPEAGEEVVVDSPDCGSVASDVVDPVQRKLGAGAFYVSVYVATADALHPWNFRLLP